MHKIDGSKWVVFNPTATDYDNSNETSGNADKDLSGTRVWLTKIDQGYTYTSTGDYGGPIPNIPAIQMQPKELDILVASPKWTASDFTTLMQCNNLFKANQSSFRDSVLQTLNFLLTQQDSTPANVASAYAALSSVTSSLNILDFDAAYTAMGNSTPAGSYTAQIKTDITSMISNYIQKYPR